MGLGDWMAINSGAVYATRAIKEIPATDTPWVRWAKKGNSVFAYIDAVGNVEFSAPASLVNDKKATMQVHEAQRCSCVRHNIVFHLLSLLSHVCGGDRRALDRLFRLVHLRKPHQLS